MTQGFSNSPIAHLAALAARTPCPSCGHRRMEFVLRCDLDTGPCLYTARCGGCGTIYELAMLDRDQLAGGEVGTLACPKCGYAKAKTSLHCEIGPRSCLCIVDCPRCGHHGRQGGQPGGRRDQLAG